MANIYDHDHEEDIIYFARTNYRNMMRKFGIKTDDRRRHTYIVGKTGMGKTVVLENMVLADIYMNHGVAVVDPHGDFAEKILNFIPEHRVKDVVYFNPSDTAHPIGFNILETVDESHKHLIASGMMGVFKKIWPDVWSARMEHIMNNCVLTLLEIPGNTMLSINRILVDRDFRRKIVSQLKDPVVKAFWITEFEQWQDKFRSEAIAPIQNKVGQFLSTSLIRNIVGQLKSTIDPREIMDNGKILIMNLSKGRIGEDSSRLLGGLVITKLQLAAMERVDLPEEERRDFYLYIDEFQNFATESFANVLSEARKYHLNLTIAHQYIEQLDEIVRPAVFGNVGTMVVFRVGAADAEFLEPEFTPQYTAEDIVNIPKWNIYIKLMIDGIASIPFSASTLPPINIPTGNEEKVIEFSRNKYTQKQSEIEESILRWSESKFEVSDSSLPEIPKEKPKTASKSWMHHYNCTRCNKDVELPVELDRNRPIYCDDCVKIVRQEQKKGKIQKQEREERKAPPPPAITQTEVAVKEAESEIKLADLSQAPSDASKAVAPSQNNVSQTAAGSDGLERKRKRRRKRKDSSANGYNSAPTQSIAPAPQKVFVPKEEEGIFPW
ncbi:MAG: hypothetical protein ACD_76C00097G0007 [uncultured bacterium]|nr:MAG: hypothetical protein ACD_76C00097G0007 [uncultured bacterium]